MYGRDTGPWETVMDSPASVHGAMSSREERNWLLTLQLMATAPPVACPPEISTGGQPLASTARAPMPS